MKVTEILDESWRNRRDAYERDYDSSVAGMGKRQSLAYQLDGGANDEGWDKEDQRPHRRSMPQSKGMYFYNVQPGQEDKARELGLSQTRSGKWYSRFDSSRAGMFFGKGRYWEPKSEGVAESATAGATSAANVAVGAVYKNKPAKTPKNKDGTAKNAIDLKGTNLLTGGSIGKQAMIKR